MNVYADSFVPVHVHAEFRTKAVNGCAGIDSGPVDRTGPAIPVLSPGNFNRVELTIAETPEEIYTPDEQWAAEMFWENFIYGFLPVFLRELILFVPIIFYFVKAKTSPAVTRFILLFADSSVLILMISFLPH